MPSDSILNPTIFIGNFEWQEPVTTLTDFAVALVCWVAFYKFYKLRQANQLSSSWFMLYFLAFAFGMTSAAWLGHGLQAYVPPQAKMVGWILGAMGILFLQLGSLQLIQNKFISNWNRYLKGLFVVQFMVAVGLMVLFFNFKVVQLNSVVGLILVVLPMHIYSYFKQKRAGSKGVAFALIYTLIPGFVYSNQLSISKWFNYHDISHVLMAIFMIFMYFSLRKLAKIGGSELI